MAEILEVVKSTYPVFDSLEISPNIQRLMMAERVGPIPTVAPPEKYSKKPPGIVGAGRVTAKIV